MNPLFSKIKLINLAKWAVITLCVLWASTTFSMALMQITTVIALVLWVIHLVRQKDAATFFSKTGAFPSQLWLPLAFFFIWVVASFFISEYPKQSFRGVLKIAKPLLVFLMCATLFRSSTAQKRFDLAFVITFALVTLDCSVQYAFGKDFLRGFSAQDSSAGLRLVGPFGDFGKMAAYLILVFPVFLMRFWGEFRQSEQRKKSFYALALAIVALALLYLTRCRGPILALLISVFLLFLYKRWFKMLGVGLVLFLAVLAFTPRGMIIHLNAEAKEQSLVERFYLWQRALDVIKAKPFTGTGINTYNKAHAKYDTVQRKNLLPLQLPGASVQIRQNQNGSLTFITKDATFSSDEKQEFIWIGDKKYNLHKDSKGKYFFYNELIVPGYYAHNGYLQLAAEIGLPGIFFFLLFLLVFFVKGARATNSVRGSPEELMQLGILTGLLAFLLYAMADTNLQSPQSLMSFWFLAGILLSRQHLQTK